MTYAGAISPLAMACIWALSAHGNSRIKTNTAKPQGIAITLVYSPDRMEPDRLRASCGKHTGLFEMATLEMTEGDLSPESQVLVRQWVAENRDRLPDMRVHEKSVATTDP